MDLIGVNNFSINYDTNTVAFRALQPNELGALRKTTFNCLVVRVEIQNQPFRLMVDTGYAGILLYEDRLRKQNRDLKTLGGTKRAFMGQRRLLHGKVVTLPGVRLGPSETQLEVFLMEGPPLGVLEGIDGILGIALLKAKRVDFDLEANRLRWN